MWILSPTLILSGEYPTVNPLFIFIEEPSSNIGTQISSVAPGNTVDSKMTISPSFNILLSDLQTFFNGVKSG